MPFDAPTPHPSRGGRAIVVLGCSFHRAGGGSLAPGALARRVAAGAEAFTRVASPDTLVVASGGRRWGGVAEADAIAEALVRDGRVPSESIVRERCSLSTRDNARFTAEALGRRGVTRAVVVTCDWHLERAMRAFRRARLDVQGAPARSSPAPLPRRAWRWGRERVLAWAVAFGPLLLGACGKGSATFVTTSDAAAPSAHEPTVFERIARAEDTRDVKAMPAGVQRSHDPTERRRAARAYARILDADDTPLLRALEDDDDETMAWGAYGLGESCHGKEDAHDKALASRLVALDPSRAVQGMLDARVAILRALGRCGGETVEPTLRAWMRRPTAAPATLEAAAYALGDVANAHKSLSLESAGALLDAAERTPPVDAALYAFGRSDVTHPDGVTARLVSDARAALARPGAARFFAVRALGRAGLDGMDDLARIVVSKDFTPPERAEAARAIGHFHAAGQGALADAITTIESDPADFMGDGFGVLLTALQGTADDDAPKKVVAAQWSTMKLEPAPDATLGAKRRQSQLRCTAASKLARGDYDADVLRGCDVGDGEAGERAELASLDHGSLAKSRRAPWLALTQSKHLRVREAAIDIVEHHPELREAALPVLAQALGASEPGVVATAADVVHAHPERVYVLAASERLAALDPAAPPPTPNPAHELDDGVAKALRAALARPWVEDQVETRVAVLDAAVAVGLDEAHAAALAACHDANATVRARAATALAASGDKNVTCSSSDAPITPAPELGSPLAHAERVVFEGDGWTAGVRFDPALAPVAASRFVALARSGFYTGVIVHRVVPGFVVQLGDRGGDGYGGSGTSLRCETSPTPFGALDVGVALAGRDTGSSQFFVTLARYPHLDGQYAWVGKADGDWSAIDEGDVVKSVKVEP